ncbi:MAG: TIGR01212 family radical SAM protein [Bacilli bacterium]|nr:TIGR01212 family radical SAM protein [Bacilli bacterium]
MFKYSLDNKRYHTLNYFLKNKFNSKVFKVSLNAGFSCPNKKNGNGCIFCSEGSGDFGGDKEKDLVTQFNEVKDKISKKWPNSKYIAYFQANSNTYAPLEELKEKYETVINLPNVVGLAIATRSDCLEDDILDYLAELNRKTFLMIELGLQSMHDKTLKLINRGHDLKNFEEAVKKLQERNIFITVHIINGLPGENQQDMIETVKYLNSLDINSLKIHMLSVLKDTSLERYYEQKKFPILSKEEYIDIVCEQLQYLNENIIIGRITGDPDPLKLIVPNWLIKKFCVLNDIDKKMKELNIYQGDKVNK